MSGRPSLLLLLFSLLFATCQRPLVVTTAPTEAPFEITILQLNDVYEIAPLEGGRVGGLARVATLLRRLEAENPNTIAVIAGDFLSPSFIGTLRLESGERVAGQQMVETLNVMGLDYAVFGNHEFDLSNDTLLGKRIDQSEFRYVCANVLHKTGGTTQPFTQDGQPVPPFIVHTFQRGERRFRLAIVGVVLPFNQQPYLTYQPVNESFVEAARTAQTQADLVVGLTHLSVDEDMELAALRPGTPLLMGGHEHQHLSRYVETSAITKADANAKTVYIHRISHDPRTGFSRIRSTLVPITNELAEEPATQAVVDRWQAITDGIVQKMGYDGEQVIAEAPQPLLATEAMIRNYPTNYGQLTARAFEAVWPGADVYMLNSGSLRIDDNLQGKIAIYDVLRSFPFGGPIAKIQINGADLARLLETGLSTNRNEGGYMQLIHVEEDNGRWMIRDQPLDPKRTYTVVLPDFVASGREANLGFLGELKKESPATLTLNGQSIKNDVRDIMINYLQDIKIAQ